MKQVGMEIPKVDVLEKALGEAKFGADLASEEPLHLKVSAVQNLMQRL